jgi:hypothetical protein
MWPSWCLTEAQKRAVRRALRGLVRQWLIVGPLRMYGIEQTWRWNVSDHPLDRSSGAGTGTDNNRHQGSP